MTTGLTEQEKESLIKYILTLGELTLKEDGTKVFRFFNNEINVDDKFTPSYLLEKAFNNIFTQTR